MLAATVRILFENPGLTISEIQAIIEDWLAHCPASPNLPFESIRFETIEVAYTEENWQ